MATTDERRGSAVGGAGGGIGGIGEPWALDRPACLEVFTKLPTLVLVERYRTASHRLDPRVLELAPDVAARGFRADEGVGVWSCVGLLGHLADSDLMFTSRMRRALAEDGPTFADFDHEVYFESQMYEPTTGGVGGPAPGGYPGGKPAAAFVAVLHTMRLWMGQYLATLGEGQFARSGVHPERGVISVRDLLGVATWHVEYHGWYLSKKLDLLVGPRDEGAAVAGGGCGPGCGCASKRGGGAG